MSSLCPFYHVRAAVLAPVVFLTSYVSGLYAQKTIHVPSDQPTIQTAINAAANGDTVLVSPGIYREQIDFKGKGITVTSGAKTYADAASTIISGPATGTVVTLQSGEPAGATLNGFTIVHGLASDGSQYKGSAVVLVSSSASITNNVISGNQGCGILAEYAPSVVIDGNWITGNVQLDTQDCSPTPTYTPAYVPILLVSGVSASITNNLIENNSTLYHAGVLTEYTQQVLLTNNVVRNNVATSNSGFNIGTPANVTMVQNLIYGNVLKVNDPTHHLPIISSDVVGPGIIISVLNAPEAVNPIHAVVLNNTVYGNTDPDLGDHVYGTEFELAGSFGNSVVANNVFGSVVADRPAVACFFFNGVTYPSTANTNISFRDNDVYGTIPQSYDCSTTGTDQNISADPKFISASTFNFRVQEGSPVIAAGDPTVSPLPLADLDGKNRFTCGAIDMGAYQFHPHPPLQLTSSKNPSFGGTNVTFGAQLTGNCNVPTGAVTFLDGTSALGVAPLSSSAYASFSTASLTVGNHTIGATYPGDFNFDTASGSLTQVVNGDPSSTTLSVSPNPAAAFNPITLSATVSSLYGQPTGAVTFTANGVVLAIAPLQSGAASAVISSLGTGSYNIVATYSADLHFAVSSSSTTVLVVNGASSATSLTTSANPAALTQSVTFVAGVFAAQGTQVPTGAVTFSDGSGLLGSANLDNSGTATFSTSSLSFGPHTITAHYTGSANFNPSSASLTETIVMIATGISLSSSPNPANVGEPVTLTAKAASSLVGTSPSGRVQFFDGASLLGSATIDSSGTAYLLASGLTVGTHPLHASLQTGTTFLGSDSPAVNEIVLAYDFTLGLAKSSVSIPGGDWTVIDVLVSPIGGFQGTVELRCDSLPDHAQCNWSSGGVASLATGPQVLQLTVNTSDVYKYGPQAELRRQNEPRISVVLYALLLCPLLLIRKRQHGIRNFSLLILAVSLVPFFQGCSSKYPSRVGPGTYNVTVSAKDSAPGSTLNHSSTLQMRVTQ